jgi:hypothetical protein
MGEPLAVDIAHCRRCITGKIVPIGASKNRHARFLVYVFQFFGEFFQLFFSKAAISFYTQVSQESGSKAHGKQDGIGADVTHKTDTGESDQ